MSAESRLTKMRKDWLFYVAAVVMLPFWLPLYAWVVIEEWHRRRHTS